MEMRNVEGSLAGYGVKHYVDTVTGNSLAYQDPARADVVFYVSGITGGTVDIEFTLSNVEAIKNDTALWHKIESYERLSQHGGGNLSSLLATAFRVIASDQAMTYTVEYKAENHA